MYRIVLCFNIFLLVAGIFSPNTKVIRLDSKNFKKVVLQSERVWFVKFYAPFCGYCQKFAPEYDKAAVALNGVVRLGAVNVEEEKDLAQKYAISGFPTIKIFIIDKGKPEEFHGERNAPTLVNAAISAIQRKVNHQLTGKPDKASRIDFKDVVKLTDNNFEDVVLASKDMWMINFNAPACSSCRQFEAIWAEAARELKGKIRFGIVDAASSKMTVERYGIKKYPDVKYFPEGAKTEIFDCNSSRTKRDIVEFALEKLLAGRPAPEINQITSLRKFNKNCEKEKLCVISFLPLILDCQSECRNAYLKMLKIVSDHFKQNPWGWMWSEAGTQIDLENLLEVGGFGYPAMVVVNLKKKKFSVLHGAFSEVGIVEFLRDLSYGQGNIGDLRSDIVIHKIKAWDGRDALQPVEIDEEHEQNKETETVGEIIDFDKGGVSVDNVEEYTKSNKGGKINEEVVKAQAEKVVDIETEGESAELVEHDEKSYGEGKINEEYAPSREVEETQAKVKEEIAHIGREEEDVQLVKRDEKYGKPNEGDKIPDIEETCRKKEDYQNEENKKSSKENEDMCLTKDKSEEVTFNFRAALEKNEL